MVKRTGRKTKFRGAPRLLAVAAACACTTLPLLAQSFNLDIDMPGAEPEAGGGVPSIAFGGAADQPGVWNSIMPGPGPFQLSGLDGAASSATLSISNPDGYSTLAFHNPDNTGDFALLLNDAMSIGSIQDGGSAIFTFNGLADGLYQVFTYATPPQGTPGELFINVIGSNEGMLATTGAMAGNEFTLGVTHVVHTINVVGGEIVIELTDLPGETPGFINGVQLVMLPAPSALLIVSGGLFFGAPRRRRSQTPSADVTGHIAT